MFDDHEDLGNFKDFLEEQNKRLKFSGREGGQRESTFIPPEDSRKSDLSPKGARSRKIFFS